MNHNLQSLKPLTKLVNSLNIFSWDTLLQFVKQLPYGRNENRHDISLVLTEQKGSCSSKHALLKTIANENNIPNIELILGMYKMNSSNTSIATTISDANLSYIPEAHCYLKINGIRTDVTSEESSFGKISDVILEEIEIEPHQVAEFKVEYHKNFIRNWISEENIKKSFDEVWAIRERCINYLSNKKHVQRLK